MVNKCVLRWDFLKEKKVESINHFRIPHTYDSVEIEYKKVSKAILKEILMLHGFRFDPNSKWKVVKNKFFRFENIAF